MMCMPTLQGNYGPNMNASLTVVTEIFTTEETLAKTCKVRRNIHTDKLKDINYIPLGIDVVNI